MSPTITVRLAQSRSEFENALRLLYQSRQQWGYRNPGSGEQQLWVLKQHAVPGTKVIVALQAGQVVGALCVFGDGPFRLPVESHCDLTLLRRRVGGPIGELSLPALHPELGHAQDTQLMLYQFAFFLCSSQSEYRAFVSELPAAWVKRNAHLLKCETTQASMSGLRLLLLNARIGRDFRADLSGALSAVFQFPEKKAVTQAEPPMPPEVMDHIFNERTQLFAHLNDFDLRLLKELYGSGGCAGILARQSVASPDPSHPRHPRFHLSCDGYFLSESGAREHLQVLDVSREGLKIFVSKPLGEGEPYALTVHVGARTSSELIASAVWTDVEAEVAGLRVHSSDRTWAELIAALETGKRDAA